MGRGLGILSLQPDILFGRFIVRRVAGLGVLALGFGREGKSRLAGLGLGTKVRPALC